MSGRLVALGDSFSCGEGVGMRTPIADTWIGLLAAALQLEVDLLAEPGMNAAEVRHHQLPRALAAPADVLTLLVGLNDVIRAGFDADATAGEVGMLVDALCAVHPVVLVVRLHDPTMVLPVPTPVREHYRRRVCVVNAAIDAAVERHGAACLDLQAIPALRERRAWAVDRLHPSRCGHRLIASAALVALAGRAPIVPEPGLFEPVAAPDERVSGLDEARWLVRHGLPWLATRLPKAVLVAGGPHRDVGVDEPRDRRGVPGPEELAHR